MHANDCLKVCSTTCIAFKRRVTIYYNHAIRVSVYKDSANYYLITGNTIPELLVPSCSIFTLHF